MTVQLIGGLSVVAQRRDLASATAKTPLVAVVLYGRFDVSVLDYLLGRVIFATRRELSEVEILVVDDGTVSNLPRELRSWEEDFGVRRVVVERESEATTAVLEAAYLTAADVFVFIEPNLSYPPEVLPRMIHEITENESELVFGVRSGPAGWLASLRSLVSWPLTGSSDPFSKLLACRREPLLRLAGDPPGPHLGLALLAKGVHEKRISEVPVDCDSRYAVSDHPALSQTLTKIHQLLAMILGDSVASWLPGLLTSIASTSLADIFLSSVVSPAMGLMGTVMAAAVSTARLPSGAWRGLVPKALVGRVAVVVIMALLMRWALLETLAQSGEPLSVLAGMSLVAASSLTILFGLALFALQDHRDIFRAAQRRVLFAGLVVFYAVALRGIFSAGVMLIKEESYYWNYAKHLALSYFDHPPLSGWMIALSTGLLGDTEFAVRLPATLSWLVAAGFLFGLTRNLAGRGAAVQAVLLLSVLPIYFGIGLIITPDSPLHAAWAGCLYFLERALMGSRPRAWLGFGICLGLGLLSKYTIVLLIPALLFYLVADRRSRRWFFNWRPAAGLLVGLLLLTPVLIWNYQNDWASIMFQGPRRWGGQKDFGFWHLVLASAAVLTPMGLVAALRLVLPRRRSGQALATAVKNEMADRQQLFVMVFTCVPLAVFVLHSLIKLPKINWTGPVWLMALPWIAREYMLDTDLELGQRRPALSRCWSPNSPTFVLIVLLILGSLLHWRLLGSPGLRPDQKREFLVWTEIGREIGRLRSDVRASTSQEPVVVGMDISEISSQVSFYDPRATMENTAGRHLLGLWSEGFMYWQDPAEALGRDLIMIAFNKTDLERSSLERYFQEMGPIVLLEVAGSGAAQAALFYRVGYAYEGE